ncbi:hypothetical protein AHAS_Ahas13G0240500 [Arachis hypogaea]
MGKLAQAKLDEIEAMGFGSLKLVPKWLVKQGIMVLKRLQEVTNKQEKSLPKEAMQNHAKEREHSNQGSPHSNESRKCKVVDLIESSIQEVLDERNTLDITQYQSPEIKEVEGSKKSTQGRIVI